MAITQEIVSRSPSVPGLQSKAFGLIKFGFQQGIGAEKKNNVNKRLFLPPPLPGRGNFIMTRASILQVVDTLS